MVHFRLVPLDQCGTMGASNHQYEVADMKQNTNTNIMTMAHNTATSTSRGNIIRPAHPSVPPKAIWYPHTDATHGNIQNFQGPVLVNHHRSYPNDYLTSAAPLNILVNRFNPQYAVLPSAAAWDSCSGPLFMRVGSKPLAGHDFHHNPVEQLPSPSSSTGDIFRYSSTSRNGGGSLLSFPFSIAKKNHDHKVSSNTAMTTIRNTDTVAPSSSTSTITSKNDSEHNAITAASSDSTDSSVGMKPHLFEKKIRWLVEFKLKHGHCSVPSKYPENQELAKWCKSIRSEFTIQRRDQKHHKPKLSAHQMQRLSRIGFPSGSTDSPDGMKPHLFEKKIRWLVEFKIKHGHCRVPVDYPENQALAIWCKSIRPQFTSRRNGQQQCKAKLSECQMQELMNIGFPCNSIETKGNRYMFQEQLNALKKFKAIHNHCHVPERYSSDPSLAAWCSEIRLSWKIMMEGKVPRTPLTAKMVQDLKDIGFL